uniref:Uncharacterized protein n=1 Tax=Tetranychus urticae TaxID=32264 RepID=T1JPQ9_TETUR
MAFINEVTDEDRWFTTSVTILFNYRLIVILEPISIQMIGLAS